MCKLTRVEIDERLEKLRESRLDDTSYFSTKPAMAMCYSMAFPKLITHKKQCVVCGKLFSIECSSNNDYIEQFGRIVKGFANEGLISELHSHCDKCVKQYSLNNFEIWLRAEDEAEWHVSIPELETTKGEEISKHTSVFEYELVKNFLSAPKNIGALCDFFNSLYNIKFRASEIEFFVGKQTIDCQLITAGDLPDWQIRREKEQLVLDDAKLFNSGKPPIDFCAYKSLTVLKALKLIKKDTDFGKGIHDHIFYRFMDLFSSEFKMLSYKGLNGKETAHNYQDAGFIKTQIDTALAKVLDLSIIYDKAEMQRNIDHIFKQNEMQEYIGQANIILDSTEKDLFTIQEYHSFMTVMYKKLQYSYGEIAQFLVETIEEKITYNYKLVKILEATAQRWLLARNISTISHAELDEYFTKKLIVNALIKSGDVMTIFSEEFKKSYLTNCIDKYAEINDLDVSDRDENLSKSGFIQPLKDLQGKEYSSLFEIQQIQERINNIISSTIGKQYVQIEIVHIKNNGEKDG